MQIDVSCGGFLSFLRLSDQIKMVCRGDCEHDKHRFMCPDPLLLYCVQDDGAHNHELLGAPIRPRGEGEWDSIL
jgi:hypothetical protein